MLAALWLSFQDLKLPPLSCTWHDALLCLPRILFSRPVQRQGEQGDQGGQDRERQAKDWPKKAEDA